MVTATLVGTVASTVIASTFSTLNLEATICIIGMLSSFAFATPPSMPHIAIISSSETFFTYFLSYWFTYILGVNFYGKT